MHWPLSHQPLTHPRSHIHPHRSACASRYHSKGAPTRGIRADAWAACALAPATCGLLRSNPPEGLCIHSGGASGSEQSDSDSLCMSLVRASQPSCVFVIIHASFSFVHALREGMGLGVGWRSSLIGTVRLMQYRVQRRELRRCTCPNRTTGPTSPPLLTLLSPPLQPPSRPARMSGLGS